MGRSYSGVDDQNLTSTPGESVIALQSATTIRPALFELITGNTGTPADAAIECRLKRFFTDDGTNTSLTADPIDPGDPASLATLTGNHTVEPDYTVGGEPLVFELNMRATFRWISAPGKEIKAPAVATEGWGFVSFHASQTTLYTCTIMWEE